MRFAEPLHTQTVPEAGISWIYLAQVLFFIGIAIALVRWIRNTVLDLGGTSARPVTPREQAVLSSIDNEAAKHLIARGLITTEALAMMSDRERMMLLTATAKQIGAPPPTSVAAPAPPPKLAPITLHCPLCGATVTPAPQPIPFVVQCKSCDRRIHVRGDGTDRISIVLSDATPGQ